MEFQVLRTAAIILTFWLFGYLAAAAWQPQEARTYVLVLPGLASGYNETLSRDIRYDLVLTNPSTTDILLVYINTATEGTVAQVVVSMNTTRIFTLEPSFASYGTGISNAVNVYSLTVPFQLQVFLTSDAYTEGFTAIASEQLLGPNAINSVYEYVITTFCETSGFCQFSVAAFENETLISVKIPDSVPSIRFCTIDGVEFNTKTNRYLKLNQAEAVQFESTADLTGTHIYSYQPIVVFSGSRDVIQGSSTAHTIEQLSPSSQWGTEFVLYGSPGSPGTYGDVLVISANWDNTIISMTGFPTIKLSTDVRTAFRRIDPGSISHVTATHTIQIMQISGPDGGLSFGMTTVPATSHRAPRVSNSCPSDDITVIIVREKSTKYTVTPTAYMTVPVPYSMYVVEVFTAQTSSMALNADGLGLLATVRCSDTAVIPANAIHTQPVTESPTPADPVPCIDGASVFLLPYQPFIRDLLHFDVVKIRYKSCGEAAILFYDSDFPDRWKLLFQITYHGITAYVCQPGCIRQDSIKINCGTPLDCSREMNVIWFRRNNGALCYGGGPSPRDPGTCISHPAGNVTAFKITGKGDNLTLRYDLEHLHGCTAYIQDSWRCEDKSNTCGQLPDICNSGTYGQWARENCARTCKFCTPDMYGRQFKVVLPEVSGKHKCVILVRAVSPGTTLAVTHDGGVLPQTDASTDEQFLFNCDAIISTNYVADCPTYSAGLATVYSDKDVTVSVFIQAVGLVVGAEMVHNYNVYPVDVFDREFMSFAFCEALTSSYCTCGLVSASGPADVVYKGVSGAPLRDIDDASHFTVTDHQVFRITLQGDTLLSNGCLFTSNKPISLFCGSDYYYLIQMTPTTFWSTHYTIPHFQDTYPFTAKMLIQSNVDSTSMTINEAANVIETTIQARGNVYEAEVGVAGQTTVITTKPVAVALVFTDKIDPSKKTFFHLPPTSGFVSPVVKSQVASELFDFFLFLVPDFAVTSATIPSGSTWRVFLIDIILGGTDGWLVVPGQYQLVEHVQDPPCIVSTVKIDDNVDNDCDGSVDEGDCYHGYGVYSSQDTDRDGRFRNDDCGGSIIAGPVQVAPPIEPLCPVLAQHKGKKYRDPGDFFKQFPVMCKINCTCPCEWMEGFDLWNNMTEYEKNAVGYLKMQEIMDVLYIDKTKLVKTVAIKKSADDKRTSSANMGYLGLGVVLTLFAALVALDSSAIIKDIGTTLSNIRAGLDRLVTWSRTIYKTDNQMDSFKDVEEDEQSMGEEGKVENGGECNVVVEKDGEDIKASRESEEAATCKRGNPVGKAVEMLGEVEVEDAKVVGDEQDMVVDEEEETEKNEEAEKEKTE